MKANVLSDGSQVTRHSPFTKTPQEAIETNTSQLENRKQINRISRISRVRKQKVEKEMEVTKMMLDTKSDQK